VKDYGFVDARYWRLSLDFPQKTQKT